MTPGRFGFVMSIGVGPALLASVWGGPLHKAITLGHFEEVRPQMQHDRIRGSWSNSNITTNSTQHRFKT